MEDIKLTDSEMNYILTNCDHSLKRAIWILDCMRLKSNNIITLDEVFIIVVDLIFSVRTGKNAIKIFDDDIRTNIYNILITNIKGS